MLELRWTRQKDQAIHAIQKIKQRAYLKLHGVILSKDDIPDRTRESLDSMFTSNAFHTTVFDKASRFNHSCTPSADMTVMNHGGILHYEWATMRDVPANEEITVSYIIPFMTRDVRQTKLFRSWGFRCVCPACEKTVAGDRMEETFVAMAEVYGKLQKREIGNHKSQLRSGHASRATATRAYKTSHSTRIRSSPQC